MNVLCPLSKKYLIYKKVKNSLHLFNVSMHILIIYISIKKKYLKK